jgi:hypothetical protein
MSASEIQSGPKCMMRNRVIGGGVGVIALDKRKIDYNCPDADKAPIKHLRNRLKNSDIMNYYSSLLMNISLL